MREIRGTELRTSSLSIALLETRDIHHKAVSKIVGYAAVFGTESEDLGGFTETIRVGAFTETLKSKPDVRALVDHDSRQILGRTKSGTLSLSVDTIGLRAEIQPPDTQVGRDVMESIRRGDIDQMSFGFRTTEDEWNEDFTRRELIGVDLFDVSVVAFPAYRDTSVAVRSRDRRRDADRRAILKIQKSIISMFTKRALK